MGTSSLDDADVRKLSLKAMQGCLILVGTTLSLALVLGFVLVLHTIITGGHK